VRPRNGTSNCDYNRFARWGLQGAPAGGGWRGARRRSCRPARAGQWSLPFTAPTRAAHDNQRDARAAQPRAV